jgi:drug/metabolite transporter (DMT)-like permease
MKNTAGAILIVLGLVVIVWGFFGFKTRDTVVNVGPIHATKDTTRHVPYGPIAGALVVVGGVVLLASGRGE